MEKGRMRGWEGKGGLGLVLTLLLLVMFPLILVTPVKGRCTADPHTVGLWHLDEVNPDGYKETTPDAIGKNPGTLGGTPTPMLVKGKFDQALNFSGRNFVYVPISFLVLFPPTPQPLSVPVSPSLNIPEEIRMEAWIKVQAFKNVTYNNIIVKCTHTKVQWQNTSRICGLAVKSGLTENVPRGALSGFVSTNTGGFNEIVTTDPVVPLNQWIHVAFTRSLTTGMHLYVNGVEKDVQAIHGVQDPPGSIRNGTEYYLGHDSKMVIDEVRISDLSPTSLATSSEIEIGPNLLAAVVIIAVVFAIAWFLRRVIRIWSFRSKSKNLSFLKLS